MMRRKGNSQELRTARKHVEGWRRRNGGRGHRVPDVLWKEAAGVARVAGVWATARALHLNYERLKARVGEVRTRKPKATSKRPAQKIGPRPSEFIDLGTAAALGGSKTVLELVRRDGEQLRIDVSDASRVDVVALARALWSRQP